SPVTCSRRSHHGGFLGGVGDVDANLWKETSHTNRDELNLFSTLVDDEDRKDARGHRPRTWVASRPSKQVPRRTNRLRLVDTNRTLRGRGGESYLLLGVAKCLT